jgi:hypothetical protein
MEVGNEIRKEDWNVSLHYCLQVEDLDVNVNSSLDLAIFVKSLLTNLEQNVQGNGKYEQCKSKFYLCGYSPKIFLAKQNWHL